MSVREREPERTPQPEQWTSENALLCWAAVAAVVLLAVVLLWAAG